jgi:hypothetical protein
MRPTVIVMPSVNHDSTQSSGLKQIDKARARVEGFWGRFWGAPEG